MYKNVLEYVVEWENRKPIRMYINFERLPIFLANDWNLGAFLSSSRRILRSPWLMLDVLILRLR